MCRPPLPPSCSRDAISGSEICEWPLRSPTPSRCSKVKNVAIKHLHSQNTRKFENENMLIFVAVISSYVGNRHALNNVSKFFARLTVSWILGGQDWIACCGLDVKSNTTIHEIHEINTIKDENAENEQWLVNRADTLARKRELVSPHPSEVFHIIWPLEGSGDLGQFAIQWYSQV